MESLSNSNIEQQNNIGNPNDTNEHSVTLNSLQSLSQAKKLLGYLIEKQKISLEDIESYFNQTNPASKSLKKDNHNKKSNLLSTCRMRSIALQFSYNGASYSGFAESVGAASDNSVEKYFFAALQKKCLISNRAECSYSRCGRTDKGVSAVGQLVALRLRSIIPANATTMEGQAVKEDDLPTNSHDSISIVSNKNNGRGLVKSVREMDYCKVLNGVLPETIRILGWCPVTDSFSARFSCSSRIYRYFFSCRNGSYNLSSMKEALQHIVGGHDFRNLCKMNIEQVSNFNRLIHSADIHLYPAMSSADGENDVRQVGYFQICGQAFLWHQIRCIAAILFLIGKNLEKPILFQQLLDITQNPSKPSYNMANELPLVLHSCHFSNLNMTYSAANLFNVTSTLEKHYEQCILTAYRVLDQIRTIKSDMKVSVDDLRQFISEQNGIIHHKNIKSKKKTKNNIDSESSPSSFLNTMEEALKSYPIHSKLVSWGEANIIISNVLPSLSNTSNTTSYIPVMERCRGTTYQEKLSSLTGKRKEKYMEQCVSKKKTKEEDAAFYKYMSQQGSTNGGDTPGNP